MANQQKPTKEHTSDDKAELYRKAFDIARNPTDFTETDITIFEDVKKSLRKEITKQIEDFDNYNKCILLIGSDYDLVSGVVSYIWDTHPFPSDNKGEIKWRPLKYKDYLGEGEDEQALIVNKQKGSVIGQLVLEPRAITESQGRMRDAGETPLSWLTGNYKDGGISFLRDINSEYVNKLKHIIRVVRNAKPYLRGGLTFTQVVPGLLIVSTDKKPDLSEDILRHFEIIRLSPAETEKGKGEGGKDVEHVTTPNNTFRLKGQKWEIAFNGKKPLYYDDYKGLHYIHHLIQHSPKEFGALALANLNKKGDRTKILNQCEAEELTDSSTFKEQEILDSKAKKEYKERLNEIDKELEEANKNNDIGQIEKLEEEKQAIVDELKNATAIKGKPRHFSDEPEKARKMITEAIKRSLEAIKEHDKDLYEYLDKHIKTGTTFFYNPEQSTDWVTSL